MIKFDVRTNAAQVQKQLNALRRDLRDKAVAMALNKVGAKATTTARQAVTAEFNLKAAEVKTLVSVSSKASWKNGSLQVTINALPKRRGHRSRNVALFAAKQVKDGVMVKIKKNGSRKLIRGAFIANKGRTVFVREGKSRLPIAAVETVDVPSMFNARRVNAKVMERVKTEWPVEARRAIAQVMRGK